MTGPMQITAELVHKETRKVVGFITLYPHHPWKPGDKVELAPFRVPKPSP